MSSEETRVDPDLQKIIRTASRPIGSSPKVTPPADMPGEEGMLAGLATLIGFTTKGVAHPLAKRERYGDIHKLQFMDRPIVAVWDADLVHRILQNEDRVWSTALGWDALSTNGLDPSVGNLGGLLSRDFEDHRAARKIVQPAFTMKAIDGYLVATGKIFDEVLPAWVASGRVDFKAAARPLLARVATHLFLGLKDPAAIVAVDSALADFWGAIFALSRNPRLSPAFARARKGFQTLLATLRALIPQRRSSEQTDVFSLICRGMEPDAEAEETLVRVFANIMLAAYDTTFVTLTSMAYLLAKHPEWQDRLREENAKVREQTGGALDGSSMKSLKQTELVWKETLRLLPMNVFLPRIALRDVDLGPFRVRAGTFVAPMNGGMGRHPRWWKEPSRFDPERFSPDRAEDRQHPGIYNPFGAGAHACIGMQLANMEVKLFWHKLLGSCSLSLEKDYEAQHTITPLGSVSGKVSLRLKARPLAPAASQPAAAE
jgi:cytochrome P450